MQFFTSDTQAKRWPVLLQPKQGILLLLLWLLSIGSVWAQTTFTGVSQSPAAGSVPYGDPVTVTATYSGTPAANEYLYLRYSADGYFSSNTVAPTTQSGATATFTIPNQTSTGNTNPTVSYYLVVSNDPNAAGSGTPSFVSISNNGGSNYTYTYSSTALSGTSQTPANGSVPYADPVTVTLNLGSTPSANEYFYLIYSADFFSSKTALAASSQSGTMVTFTITNQATTNNPNPTVAYFLVSSPATTAAAEISANYPYIQILNNGGANYSYAYNRSLISGTTRTPSGTVNATVPVTVNSPLSRTPDATEYFYVRYTTDGYSTSTIASMSVSGSTATGTIAGQPTGANVSYYIFSSPTSTLAGNYTGGAGGYNSIASDNNGGSNFSYTVAGPLPVSLTRFEAARQDQHVSLTWVTASETDNAGFEVQVSQDGQTFRRLGFVASASPNSLTARTYSFVDREPNQAATRYYRLRQVDQDGTGTYSPVRVVAGRREGLTLYPNPAVRTTILSGAETGALVQVYDMMGQRVLTTQADAAGRATLELHLPGGVYLVRSGAGPALRLTVE